MKKFRKITQTEKSFITTQGFEGESIEEKVFSAVNSNTPIESVAPMVYTERKDGVLPETNIRTDRFELAQEAMTNIANGTRENRAKKILKKMESKTTVTPGADGGNETA